METGPDSESKESLVARLRDPATKGRRGSIVWQLKVRNYDCTGIFSDLITCLLEGSFEEVQHAHDILVEMDTLAPTADYLRVRAAMTSEPQDWRREAIVNVFEMFDEEDFEPEKSTPLGA